MNDIYCIVILFAISLLIGYISIISINRFMDGKIEQWSFEYQVFGFWGMLVSVFGMIISIGNGIAFIFDNFIM